MANYLYNGVKLPELPEKSSTNYSISLRIVRRVVTSSSYYSFDGYYHTVVYAGCTCSLDSDGNLVITANGVGSPSSLPGKMQPSSDTLRIGETSWSLATSASWLSTTSFPLEQLVWTAEDIYDSTSGELIMAASDPIPIGTAPTIEPLSMWMGWKAGNWVARQRGTAEGQGMTTYTLNPFDKPKGEQYEDFQRRTRSEQQWPLCVSPEA